MYIDPLDEKGRERIFGEACTSRSLLHICIGLFCICVGLFRMCLGLLSGVRYLFKALCMYIGLLFERDRGIFVDTYTSKSLLHIC